MSEQVRQYRSHSTIPPLFASDLENGSGSMIPGLTALPHLMAVGAADDDELAYEYGRATAVEAKAIGINWTFAPVADLNRNRFNPIVNARSISDEPKQASRLLGRVVQGMQAHGLAATAKHFPGDGEDYRNQHFVTSSNELPFEEWKQLHGAVFQSLIDQGVAAIMTGHITLPAYQQSKQDGFLLPATLSEELTTHLLKNEMRFEGVVVSDALIMGGFLGWYDRAQAEVECFRCGTDMLLFPTLGYIDALEQAIESGEVSMERLDDAVERIWKMKERFGLFESPAPQLSQLTELQQPSNKPTEPNSIAISAATRMAERSLTLLSNRAQLLPLPQSNPSMLVVPIVTKPGATELFTPLMEELAQYGVNAIWKDKLWIDELEDLAKIVDHVLFVIHNYIGHLDFATSGRGALWSALCFDRAKTIGISFGSPYYYKDYFETAGAFVNAYSPVEASQRAAVRALFGSVPFRGSSPVRL